VRLHEEEGQESRTESRRETSDHEEGTEEG
jgi:hypothetical protein